MTIKATSIMYMLIPMEDSRFSAMNTSEKVPSDRTSASMIPTAKKHSMTNQYILVTNVCRSRNFMSS